VLLNVLLTCAVLKAIKRSEAITDEGTAPCAAHLNSETQVKSPTHVVLDG